MNKFLTLSTGGLDFRSDDLRFEQDAVRDALRGILSSAGDCVLSGCAITGVVVLGVNKYRCAPGYVAIDGEVYKVNGSDVVTGLAFYYLEVDESYDTAGNKTFADLGTHQTYLVRVATFKGGASLPSGAVDTATVKKFSELISADALDQNAALELVLGELNTNFAAHRDAVVAFMAAINQAYTQIALASLTVANATLDTGAAFFIQYKREGSTCHVQARLKLTVTSPATSFSIAMPVYPAKLFFDPCFLKLDFDIVPGSYVTFSSGYFSVTCNDSVAAGQEISASFSSSFECTL